MSTRDLLKLSKRLHCDVFLGPHARFFSMAEKVQRMNASSTTNPFIDPDGYQNFLGNFERAYKEQIKHEQSRIALADCLLLPALGCSSWAFSSASAQVQIELKPNEKPTSEKKVQSSRVDAKFQKPR